MAALTVKPSPALAKAVNNHSTAGNPRIPNAVKLGQMSQEQYNASRPANQQMRPQIGTMPVGNPQPINPQQMQPMGTAQLPQGWSPQQQQGGGYSNMPLPERQMYSPQPQAPQQYTPQTGGGLQYQPQTGGGLQSSPNGGGTVMSFEQWRQRQGGY